MQLLSICRNKNRYFEIWIIYSRTDEIPIRLVTDVSEEAPCLRNDVNLNLRHIVHTYKLKVKWSRYRPGVIQRMGRGIALHFHDRGTRRGEWSAAGPGRTLPPGKTRDPFCRRLGEPQSRSGRAENLVRTGIRPRTVQPVVSRYTDWATGPTVRIN